jgi:tetratricopeptide (TPR) repeat protein
MYQRGWSPAEARGQGPLFAHPMKNAWRSSSAGAVVIVALTFLVYLPVLRGGFVFDDHELITDNPIVHARDGLYRFWFTAEAADYRPLTWSLWWAEWQLWDGRATGYHVVNVFLFAVDAVLVWLILRRLRIPGAWLAAAAFAVHPVNVATGAWISEQKNTLSMLFYALSILLYLRFDESDRAVVGPRCDAAKDRTRSTASLPIYALSLLAFVLALLSKTAVVMLPVVLLGCVWWRHERVRARDWFRSAPYFAAAMVLALVTILQHQRALPGGFVRPAGFGTRLVMAGQVPWVYLSKALAPVDLMVIYPKWEIDASRWVSFVPGILLIAGFAFFWWNRAGWGRALLFGLGYYVVTLFPVLGFFDQGFYYHTWVADHWQYHAIVGVIALVVGGGWTGVDRLGKRGRAIGLLAPLGAGLASAAVLIALGSAAWMRSRVYVDGEALWRDTVSKNPDSWLAQNNLGAALQASGELTNAIGHYEQALRLKPDAFDAHNNLGSALMDLGRVPDAMEQFQEALRLKPDLAAARNNLGNALFDMGRVTEAIGQYKEALRAKPDFAAAHYNLGMVLARAGRMPEAMEQWDEALRLKPDYVEAHNTLGVAFYQLGEVTEAIQQYEQALRIRPNYVEARHNLGVALTEAGRIQEAIGQYERVLQLKPDSAEAHSCLGDILLRSGRVTEAIGHYERALRVKPDSVDVHNNLGAALVQLGRYPEAIRQFEEVLRLKPDLAATHFNLGMVFERSGRVQEAIAQYEQVLRLEPDSTEARNRLAKLRDLP